MSIYDVLNTISLLATVLYFARKHRKTKDSADEWAFHNQQKIEDLDKKGKAVWQELWSIDFKHNLRAIRLSKRINALEKTGETDP